VTTAREVLDRLSAVGVRVSRDGPYIRVRPLKSVTAELRDMVQRHRTDVMDELAKRLEVDALLAILQERAPDMWPASEVEEAAQHAYQDADSALTSLRVLVRDSVCIRAQQAEVQE
jgi:DNA-binding FadR family transcriptional regulator